MSISNHPITVNEAFFQPLAELCATSKYARPCPKISDEQWIKLGLHRVLEAVESGRAFLQEHGPRFENIPCRSSYFDSLVSERRCNLARDVNLRLIGQLELPNRLEAIPELAKYECFAMDGHWHSSATHDPRHEGKKMAVGHFYSLDLKGHQLRHLAVGQGVHEHDMTVLKRLKPKGLRHEVPKGKRVVIVYDKAAIDFQFWKRCRHECAVYFISRPKEGMVYDWIESRLIDKRDKRNRGVTEDRVVMTREGHKMRIIFYTDPQTGKCYEFLTNEMDLPAGVIAELYRRRWEVEKVFDEIKNKLNEKKAWATSLVAKAAQGQMVAITHNLMLAYEVRLEDEHGVSNDAEDKRRLDRMRELKKTARIAGRETSVLLLTIRRTTQRSVKFVRWLRHALRENLAESLAIQRLALLYADL